MASRRRSALVIALLGVVAVVLLGACAQEAADRRSSSSDDVSVPPARGHEIAALPAGESRSDDVIAPSTSTTTTTAAPTTTTTTAVPAQPTCVIPSDVLFDTASAELRPEADEYLGALADEIKRTDPNARLEFIGHTDSRGTEEYNLDLSRRRAESVLTWFARAGFAQSQMSSDGAGESERVADDLPSGRYDEEAGRKNRRVEIVVTSAGSPLGPCS